jgi:Ricin-type beta-trefoil lectin domain-like
VLSLGVGSSTAAGSYSLTVTASDTVSGSSQTAPVSLIVQPSSELPSGGLPTNWQNQDIGQPSSPGQSAYSNGLFQLAGSGSGVTSSATSDQLQYAYTTLNGDGTVVARLLNVQGWAESGVMIRNSLDADSEGVMLYASDPYQSQYGYWRFGSRSSDGAQASIASYAGSVPISLWLKLTRQGNNFSAALSLDGIHWIPFADDQGNPVVYSISMNTTVYAGLMASAGNGGAENITSFDNVSVTSTGAGFSLSTFPATLQVQNSQTVVAAVTASAGSDFTDAINLSISGLPSGATGAFSPGTLNGAGSSMLALSLGSNTAPGIYTLTVTGTDSSTGTTESALVSLTILPVAVPNGTYTLTNNWSGFLLTDPSGSTAPGTQMVQSTATGGTEQQWKFVFQPSGYYTIQNVASELYLTDTDSSSTPGTELEEQAVANDDSQLWSLTASSAGVLITNKATGLVIDDSGQSTTSGTGIILWTSSGGANQVWTLNGRTTALPNGNYTLTNGSTGLVLADPAASTSSGTQIIQSTATGDEQQLWKFVLQPSGYYTIQNLLSLLFLADPGASDTPGTALEQITAANDDSELWGLYVTGAGYEIVNKATGLAIDDPNYSSSDGTGMDLWTANGGANQIWAATGVDQGLIPNGTYILENGASGLLLTDPGGSLITGTQIVQSSPTAGTEQQWQFVFQPSGYYTIQNVASQLYLTDTGGSSTPGTLLEQTSATNDDSQLWVVIGNGFGIMICNKATGLAIDDPGWDSNDGTVMDLWTLNWGYNQTWSVQ